MILINRDKVILSDDVPADREVLFALKLDRQEGSRCSDKKTCVVHTEATGSRDVLAGTCTGVKITT